MNAVALHTADCVICNIISPAAPVGIIVKRNTIVVRAGNDVVLNCIFFEELQTLIAFIPSFAEE